MPIRLRRPVAALVEKLGLKQPANGIARSRDEAAAVAARIGYPVLLRPSYVLGGRAMEIVDSEAQLDNYIATAVNVSGDSPVLIDQYLRDAIECDVDGDKMILRARAQVRDFFERSGSRAGDTLRFMRVGEREFLVRRSGAG